MNCNNCTNSNALKEVKIKHVHGNVLRMAIPLTLRTIELVDGEINATDTPFVPSSEHPVKVVFSKDSVSVALDATMKDGNIAYIEEKGKITVGTYAITVTCNDDNGNPYRFKQNAVLYVADATIEAGIEETIEYEVTTWYLDAAIFLALKGEDGVGIADIETQSSGEIGGVNTVTFILTDGRTRSFTILNGSGAVDSDLDINSPSPIANSAVTAKFNELSGELADLFGDVDYDSSAKSIRFWDKGKTNVLASLDARPFIKDGMVSNAYISNNTLVITFNTDSGKEAIGVPLTSVFNPNNYYTKTQVDSRIASAISNLTNYYTKSQTDNRIAEAVDNISIDLSEVMTKDAYLGRDGRLKGEYATQIMLYYMGEPYDEGITTTVQPHQPIFENGYIHYSTGSSVVTLGLPQSHIVYCNAKTNKLYRWNGSEFVQVGGSNSEGGYEPPVGGIPKSDLAQSVQDTLDDVSNKVDKVTGKGLSTEDYTTAEKQKLAGLSNYDDTEIQAEVDAKYEKPSTGIPKSDLASGVQSSLDAADSAYQKPNGGIPKTDLSNDVQTSLGKADTALQSHQSLADVFAIVDYDSTTKHINFYGKGDTNKATVLGYVDATNFIKDGMVSNVAISNGNLVVTFNTDSGKEPISIALTQIFNPENYYNKTAVDGLIANKVDKETGKSLMTDAERTKLQGIAAGAEVNVQPNWTQTNTSADDYIKNKPTLATVATSGSYNDLSNKPTIPAAYDDTTLSGRVSVLENAGFITTETDPTVPSWAKQQTKPTYTAQEVGALPASTPIPTKTSDLTNDSGFTSNAGTITGITMNGVSKGTSGVVDLGTVITAHQDISGKANASDVYTKTQTDTLLAGRLSKSDVSVETQGDGTVDINVKDDTYTINLNHTHEGMAKLVKCTEATLPQTLDDDTIYVQVDNLTTPTEIEALHIFGLEFTGGGAAPGVPYLSSPGANISMGDSENGSVTKAIRVKGRYLTQALSVALTGTGYTFGATQPTGVTRNSDTSLTITADAAKAGVDIPVIYTGAAFNATATLAITSSSPDSIDTESTLVANSATIENLAAVKLTGTQWMQTDYYPNPNTRFEFDCKFIKNTYSSTGTGENKGTFLGCDHDGDKRFSFNNGAYYVMANSTNKGFSIYAWVEHGYVEGGQIYSHEYGTEQAFCQRGVMSYSNGSISFLGSTWATETRVSTSQKPLNIGYLNGTIYGNFDLEIYELKLYNGNTLVYDFKPVSKDGVYGLLDAATGTFISSQTNSPLIPIFLT